MGCPLQRTGQRRRLRRGHGNDGSGNVYVTGGSDLNVLLILITIKYDSPGKNNGLPAQWRRQHRGFANAIAVDGSAMYMYRSRLGIRSDRINATVNMILRQQQWVPDYDGPANRSRHCYGYRYWMARAMCM